MPVALLACAALIWLADPASAEDFSGFYAGVNAGYAFQNGDRAKREFGADTLRGADSAPGGSSLPPSAQEASRALQSRNRSQGLGTLPH